MPHQSSSAPRFDANAGRNYRSRAAFAVAVVGLLFLGAESTRSEPPASNSGAKPAPSTTPAAAGGAGSGETLTAEGPGLVKAQPTQGRFVKTDQGFMVPY